MSLRPGSVSCPEMKPLVQYYLRASCLVPFFVSRLPNALRLRAKPIVLYLAYTFGTMSYRDRIFSRRRTVSLDGSLLYRAKRPLLSSFHSSSSSGRSRSSSFLSSSSSRSQPRLAMPSSDGVSSNTKVVIGRFRSPPPRRGTQARPAEQVVRYTANTEGSAGANLQNGFDDLVSTPATYRDLFNMIGTQLPTPNTNQKSEGYRRLYVRTVDVNYFIKNDSNVIQYLNIYTYGVKQSTPANLLTQWEQAPAQLTSTSDSGIVPWQMVGATPYDASLVTDYFNILKVQRVVLRPGQVHEHHVQVHLNREIRAEMMATITGPGNLVGLTYGNMFVFHGTPVGGGTGVAFSPTSYLVANHRKVTFTYLQTEIPALQYHNALGVLGTGNIDMNCVSGVADAYSNIG